MSFPFGVGKDIFAYMNDRIRLDIVIGDRWKKYSAPRSWNAMSKRDLMGWCGVLQLSLTREEALDMAAILLYGIKARMYAGLPITMRYDIRNTMSYLTENKLTANVIGRIGLLGRGYHGPENRLANLTISEYRRTEIYYQLYIKHGEKRSLMLLVATLWRPKGGNNPDDVRVRMDERSINRRADFMSWAMHPNIAHAILLFYEGCRNYIMSQHRQVYPVKKESEDMGPFAPKSNPGELVDLEDHILAYAGGKLGNYAETEKTNVYVFLKNMCQRIDEMERVKK